MGDKLLNEISLNSHQHYRKTLLTPKKSYKISVVMEKATISRVSGDVT